MACFYPLKGYRSRARNPSGTRSIVFNPLDGLVDLPVTVPCGQCVGCRLERSRVWAVRCMHEASLYQNNSFITLTYSDNNIPYGNTLVKSDFQKFMKKLRFHHGDGIRFFHCGEYGEKTFRPHYHALLFNFDFKDRVPWKQNSNGDMVFLSRELENLWGYGLTTVGDVTFQSAAYVARYIMKKVTGHLADPHYQFVDGVTGEITQRQPEYVTMSRRPGIGTEWYRKFKMDVFPHDRVIMNGSKFRPPRFYDGLYEIDHPQKFQRLKGRRKRNAAKHAENNTPERLLVREEVQLARTKRLKREI